MNTENMIWDEDSQMWKDSQGNFINEIFCDFEDVHLEGNARDRYKLRHDTTISNFQYTVMESKTDTLGGKYPFIRRNGDTYYRQFPLAGLITHFNENDYPDEYLAENLIHNASNGDGNPPMEDSFSKKIKERVADNNLDLKGKYDASYYSDKTLNGYTDYLLEREYRDDVTKFFYEDKVRLFRSPTEGNIIVKLMNVSLTPNEQIKRRVSAVQCTAYEVDDCTVEKCIEYKIWDDNKSIFTDFLVSGTLAVHVGQIKHDDPADLTSQEYGPYLKTDFYQEIINDVIAHHNSTAINVEKVIWMKSSFYSSSSYFGYDKDGMVTWAVLPNSPIISELIITTNGQPDDDDIEVEIRTYDITYPYNDPDGLWTKFFENAISPEATAAGALTACFQQLQRLAYIVVRYCWGEVYTYDGMQYSWDDINDWDTVIKAAFLTELQTKPWASLTGPLYTKDTNNNTVLKNKPAWSINTIIQCCDEMVAGKSGSRAANYIERVTEELEEDPLLESVENYFDGLTCIDGLPNRVPMAAQAMLNFSVGFIIEPFNGYWQIGGLYDIVPLDDPRNIYGKPFIDFWLALAVTMTIYGEWGFGKASKENLKAKTVRDLTDGKAILIDANLTTNVLTSLRTTDIDLIGHGMYINNELIVVPPQGYYELTDKDTSITQFSQQRLKDEPLKCLIDYAALYRSYTSEDLANMRRTIATYYKVGQIRGVTEEQDVINQIKEKYAFDDGFSSVEILAVPYVSIEAEPYTRAFIKDSSDSNIEEHIINDDGIMTFYNEGTAIEQLYFDTYESGVHDIVIDRNETVYNNSYALEDLIVNYICLIKEIK